MGLTGGAAGQASTQCFVDHIIPQPPIEAGDYYGSAVDVGRNHAVVGAILHGEDAEGLVVFYHRVDGEWQVQQSLQHDDPEPYDTLGNGVSISGNLAIGAAPQVDGNKGAVFVFERDSSKPAGQQWSQQTFLQPADVEAGDRFGGTQVSAMQAVAIEDDVIVAGAPRAESGGLLAAGKAYVFRYTGGAWQEEAIIEPPDPQQLAEFGQAVAIRGDTIAISSPSHDVGSEEHAGRIDLFTRVDDADPPEWVHDTTLTSASPLADDEFGFSVDMDGRFLVAGAPERNAEGGKGFATVFRETAQGWVVEEVIQPTNIKEGDLFAYSASISGTNAIFGAWKHDHPNGEEEVGTVYFYRRDTTDEGPAWFLQTQMYGKNELGETNDRFGWSVSLNGSEAFIGAMGDQPEDQGNTANFGSVSINTDLPSCP